VAGFVLRAQTLLAVICKSRLLPARHIDNNDLQREARYVQ
jgi:hypothetical protein